ncbi:MAG: double-strand break repair helicase AddA [Pseudomonadota bacterium]|nr:double-strand break repair helicase AddA [Pseudomonadota bacterium]
MRPPDPAVVQRRASDPDVSVWVGASAGTGKTRVLTDRVLRLLLAGTLPQRILCLTYTKAAATEMANRLNDTLGLWATVGEGELDGALERLLGRRAEAQEKQAARRLFAQVLECPGGMNIQTIHAFCQSLLGRFPLEAGVRPGFTLLDDRGAQELLDQALHRVLQQARDSEGNFLAAAVSLLTERVHADGFRDLVHEMAAQRSRLRRVLEIHGGVDGAVQAVSRFLNVSPDETPDSISLAACQDAALDLAGLRKVCALLSRGSKTDVERGQGIQAWLDAAPDQRVKMLDIYTGHFTTKDGDVLKTLATKKVLEAAPDTDTVLRTEARRLLALEERRQCVETARATAAFLHLGDRLLDIYGGLLSARGAMDFDSVILSTCRLLGSSAMAPWVLFRLDGGLDHILVDEAQDTNPEQWQIVAALAEEFFSGQGARETSRTLFVVGDEKQSIFSFQRADVAEFSRMRQYFDHRIAAAGQDFRPVDMTISFRSTDAVLKAVDRVFALPAARDGVADQAVRHTAYRRGQAGVVELWPLVTAAEGEEDRAPWTLPLKRVPLDDPAARLAGIIAGRIRTWLDSGEVLASRNRPVRPGDIMILVQRRDAFMEHMVRALKDRQIPVMGIDRMVLAQQLAVQDLCALGHFLLYPGDDLTLASLLKTPLVGLSEDDLFALAWKRKGTLWQALADREGEGEPWAGIHAWLSGLLERTDFVSPFALFSGVLSTPCPADARSGRRAFLKRLGAEAREALDEFLSACLMFGRDHPSSLQMFLHWIATDASAIKREMDAATGDGEGQVRIMTTHGAKGLQAPIVFLPDTTRVSIQTPDVLWPDTFVLAQPARHAGERLVPLCSPRKGEDCTAAVQARQVIDHRRDQEARRLLYVAMTRAEDRLYVCGYETGVRRRGLPDNSWYTLVSQALADFGQPVDVDFATDPGRRYADVQTAPPEKGLDSGVPPSAILPLEEWVLQPLVPDPVPGRPLSPSRPAEPDPPVRSPVSEGDDTVRFRRGIIIHRLLQTLPALPVKRRREAARRFLDSSARDLPAPQQDRILEETLAVLEHPDFTPLFGPDSQAEVPVVAVLDGRVLSGQIDRLCLVDGEVWIVDYKTNRPPPDDAAGVAPVYVAQLAAYREAFERIWPDRRIRTFLLWTDVLRLMEIQEAGT